MLYLVLIAALAADGSDAGWGAQLYAKCPEAPPAEQLDGGAWLLPPARAARVECLMATCRARQEQLEQAPPVTPAAVLIAVVAGLAVGAVGGGYLVWQLKR